MIFELANLFFLLAGKQNKSNSFDAALLKLSCVSLPHSPHEFLSHYSTLVTFLTKCSRLLKPHVKVAPQTAHGVPGRLWLAQSKGFLVLEPACLFVLPRSNSSLSPLSPSRSGDPLAFC